MKSCSNSEIRKLLDCYYQGFEFPKMYDTTLMNSCKVFYHKMDNVDDVKRLVREREPTNIAMNRIYDEDKLYKHFHFRKGYYRTCPISKNNVTPPNFIVYTPSIVLHFDKIVHILNAIGLAFDSKKQRDFKLYSQLSKKPLGFDPIHILNAKKFYRRLFSLIFETALYLEKKTIVMSLVGANNFATLWKEDAEDVDVFTNEIWLPTFHKTVKKYKDSKLNIMFMGADIPGYTNLGYFPKLLLHPKLTCINKTLFINAWDPWSVPGNGNKGDNSLDGYFGRNTQIGILGNSLTNHYLKEDENYISITTSTQQKRQQKQKDTIQEKRQQKDTIQEKRQQKVTIQEKRQQKRKDTTQQKRKDGV